MLYTVLYFVRIILFIRLFSIWFCECFVMVTVSVVQILALDSFVFCKGDLCYIQCFIL